MQVQGVAHDLRLECVPYGELNGARNRDGQHSGKGCDFRVHQDDGQGQQGSDDGADARDEIQQEGEQTEHERQVDAEHAQDQSHEQSGRCGEGCFCCQVALDVRLDLVPDSGQRRPSTTPDQEEDDEDQHEDGLREEIEQGVGRPQQHVADGTGRNLRQWVELHVRTHAEAFQGQVVGRGCEKLAQLGLVGLRVRGELSHRCRDESAERDQ